MVIIGSGKGEKVVGKLLGTVVVVGRSAGEIVVVVVSGTSTVSTGV